MLWAVMYFASAQQTKANSPERQCFVQLQFQPSQTAHALSVWFLPDAVGFHTLPAMQQHHISQARCTDMRPVHLLCRVTRAARCMDERNAELLEESKKGKVYAEGHD